MEFLISFFSGTPITNAWLVVRSSLVLVLGQSSSHKYNRWLSNLKNVISIPRK